jgi:hypothetical protein
MYKGLVLSHLILSYLGQINNRSHPNMGISPNFGQKANKQSILITRLTFKLSSTKMEM